MVAEEQRSWACEAGDTVDTRGLNGLGQGHGRQDGGEAPRQYRFTCL
jgi:hypothetical protein